MGVYSGGYGSNLPAGACSGIEIDTHRNPEAPILHSSSESVVRLVGFALETLESFGYMEIWLWMNVSLMHIYLVEL